MAVAFEDGREDDTPFTEPKELKDLKTMAIEPDEIQRLRTCEFILNKIIEKNFFNIMIASEIGSVEMVDWLLQDPRVDPSEQNNRTIIKASKCGHVAVVDKLLQDPRVDPSDQNNCAISWASYYGYVAVVARLLQDPRVDPTANNNEAIRIANQYGHVAVVELLQAHGCVLPAEAPVAP